jgi:glucosamine-6-phosphate deaminase
LRNYDGVGTILETRKILLLASGMNKAKAIAKAIEGPVTAMVPASALQLRHEVMVILDKAAPIKLRDQKYYRRVLEMTARSGRSGLGKVLSTFL